MDRIRSFFMCFRKNLARPLCLQDLGSYYDDDFWWCLEVLDSSDLYLRFAFPIDLLNSFLYFVVVAQYL